VPQVSTSSPTDICTKARCDIEIKGFAFLPDALVVKVGTTVRWTNLDDDTHNVHQGPDGPLNSASLVKNATYSFTFKNVGSYGYVCSIHPGMSGTVVVTK
jgi:plastocyanin